MPRVYVPHDGGIHFTFGAYDFELEGNAINDLDNLAKSAKREDITAAGLLAQVLQVYGPQGVREMPDDDSKASKVLVDKAEEIHRVWLGSSLGALLARHKKQQEDDKAKGLKPRPDTEEVEQARKTLKAWDLL